MKARRYMPDKIALARGWFLKAESDLADAQRTLKSDGPYDTACFHAQQAAEKYVKGFLALHGFNPPRTHNLEELQHWGESVVSHWPLAGADLTNLTPYAVEMRYDFDFWPDHQTALEAIQLANEVRNRVLAAVPDAARPETKRGG
jgi:HEPN domain-containing protein